MKTKTKFGYFSFDGTSYDTAEQSEAHDEYLRSHINPSDLCIFDEDLKVMEINNENLNDCLYMAIGSEAGLNALSLFEAYLDSEFPEGLGIWCYDGGCGWVNLSDKFKALSHIINTIEANKSLLA